MYKINNLKKSMQPISFSLGLIFLLISFAVNKLQIGDGKLLDRFHFGEYFASLSSIIHKTEFIPLTIHGALDYAPGLLAISVFGDKHYLFPTYLIYLSLNFIGCILFLVIIYRFSNSFWQILIASLIAPYLVDCRDFSFLLLLSFYFFVPSINGKFKQYFFLLLLGFLGTFNFFYSTNRGVAGTISVGMALLVLAYFQKAYFFAVISFAFFVLLASFMSPLTSLQNYLANILFLTKTSYQWSYDAHWIPISFSIFLALNLAIPVYLQVRLVASGKATLPFQNLLANLVLFIFASIFFYQIGAYRADFEHAKMGMMIAFLSITYALSIEGSDKKKLFSVVFLLALNLLLFRWDILLALLFLAYFLNFLTEIRIQALVFRVLRSLLFIVCAVYFFHSLWFGFKDNLYAWTNYVVSPKSNMSSVDESVRWAANELARMDAKCVFDLTNSGLINGVANLPACTRFSYIVYADRKFEGEIIQSLENLTLPVIIYSSDYWSYKIDQKSMASRFPELDIYVRKNFPFEVCNLGYCMRYKTPFLR